MIELDTIRTATVYRGASARPPGRYDLVVDGVLSAQHESGGGDVITVDLTTGTGELEPGPARTVRFDGLPEASKRVEIWLPWNEPTLLVALRTDRPVTPLPTGERRRWLHHGSSISHGSNADSPTGIWPAVAALRAGVDLINLGLGGSAVLDPFTARTMRDAPADLISVKLGINIVNTDLMRMRALTPAVHGFLDTVREGHPDTPLLVVSALWCGIHEETPGPAALDQAALAQGVVRFRATGDPAEVAAGRLTLHTIRDELARIVDQRRADDPHLHYLDGRALYAESDAATLPLPDDLHPTPEAHRLIGARFADLVFDHEGPFAESPFAESPFAESTRSRR